MKDLDKFATESRVNRQSHTLGGTQLYRRKVRVRSIEGRVLWAAFLDSETQKPLF